MTFSHVIRREENLGIKDFYLPLFAMWSINTISIKNYMTLKMQQTKLHTHTHICVASKMLPL